MTDSAAPLTADLIKGLPPYRNPHCVSCQRLGAELDKLRETKGPCETSCLGHNYYMTRIREMNEYQVEIREALGIPIDSSTEETLAAAKRAILQP